ncbi:MAG: hypothetical protein HYS71_00885, partial [Candidatus Omnitrophica bacterium]|nr:hypothetical protein [Candidatus Omnitrophota bacterium]
MPEMTKRRAEETSQRSDRWMGGEERLTDAVDSAYRMETEMAGKVRQAMERMENLPEEVRQAVDRELNDMTASRSHSTDAPRFLAQAKSAGEVARFIRQKQSLNQIALPRLAGLARPAGHPRGTVSTGAELKAQLSDRVTAEEWNAVIRPRLITKGYLDPATDQLVSRRGVWLPVVLADLVLAREDETRRRSLALLGLDFLAPVIGGTADGQAPQATADQMVQAAEAVVENGATNPSAGGVDFLLSVGQHLQAEALGLGVGQPAGLGTNTPERLVTLAQLQQAPDLGLAVHQLALGQARAAGLQVSGEWERFGEEWAKNRPVLQELTPLKEKAIQLGRTVSQLEAKEAAGKLQPNEIRQLQELQEEKKALEAQMAKLEQRLAPATLDSLAPANASREEAVLLAWHASGLLGHERPEDVQRAVEWLAVELGIRWNQIRLVDLPALMISPRQYLAGLSNKSQVASDYLDSLNQAIREEHTWLPTDADRSEITWGVIRRASEIYVEQHPQTGVRLVQTPEGPRVENAEDRKRQAELVLVRFASPGATPGQIETARGLAQRIDAKAADLLTRQQAGGELTFSEEQAITLARQQLIHVAIAQGLTTQEQWEEKFPEVLKATMQLQPLAFLGAEELVQATAVNPSGYHGLLVRRGAVQQDLRTVMELLDSAVDRQGVDGVIEEAAGLRLAPTASSSVERRQAVFHLARAVQMGRKEPAQPIEFTQRLIQLTGDAQWDRNLAGQSIPEAREALAQTAGVADRALRRDLLVGENPEGLARRDQVELLRRRAGLPDRTHWNPTARGVYYALQPLAERVLSRHVPHVTLGADSTPMAASEQAALAEVLGAFQIDPAQLLPDGGQRLVTVGEFYHLISILDLGLLVTQGVAIGIHGEGVTAGRVQVVSAEQVGGHSVTLVAIEEPFDNAIKDSPGAMHFEDLPIQTVERGDRVMEIVSLVRSGQIPAMVLQSNREMDKRSDIKSDPKEALQIIREGMADLTAAQGSAWIVSPAADVALVLMRNQGVEEKSHSMSRAAADTIRRPVDEQGQPVQALAESVQVMVKPGSALAELLVEMGLVKDAQTLEGLEKAADGIFELEAKLNRLLVSGESSRPAQELVVELATTFIHWNHADANYDLAFQLGFLSMVKVWGKARGISNRSLAAQADLFVEYLKQQGDQWAPALAGVIRQTIADSFFTHAEREERLPFVSQVNVRLRQRALAQAAYQNAADPAARQGAGAQLIQRQQQLETAVNGALSEAGLEEKRAAPPAPKPKPDDPTKPLAAAFGLWSLLAPAFYQDEEEGKAPLPQEVLDSHARIGAKLEAAVRTASEKVVKSGGIEQVSLEDAVTAMRQGRAPFILAESGLLEQVSRLVPEGEGGLRVDSAGFEGGRPSLLRRPVHAETKFFLTKKAGEPAQVRYLHKKNALKLAHLAGAGDGPFALYTHQVWGAWAKAKGIEIEVVAGEIDPTRYEIHQRNLKRYGLQDKVRLILGNALHPDDPEHPVKPEDKPYLDPQHDLGRYDLVIGNIPARPTPPAEMFAEDRDRVLAASNEGGPTGRAFLNPLIARAGEWVKPEGALILTHNSYLDAQATFRTMEAAGFVAPRVAVRGSEVKPEFLMDGEDLYTDGLTSGQTLAGWIDDLKKDPSSGVVGFRAGTDDKGQTARLFEPLALTAVKASVPQGLSETAPQMVVSAAAGKVAGLEEMTARAVTDVLQPEKLARVVAAPAPAPGVLDRVVAAMRNRVTLDGINCAAQSLLHFSEQSSGLRIGSTLESQPEKVEEILRTAAILLLLRAVEGEQTGESLLYQLAGMERPAVRVPFDLIPQLAAVALGLKLQLYKAGSPGSSVDLVEQGGRFGTVPERVYPEYAALGPDGRPALYFLARGPEAGRPAIAHLQAEGFGHAAAVMGMSNELSRVLHPAEIKDPFVEKLRVSGPAIFTFGKDGELISREKPPARGIVPDLTGGLPPARRLDVSRVALEILASRMFGLIRLEQPHEAVRVMQPIGPPPSAGLGGKRRNPKSEKPQRSFAALKERFANALKASEQSGRALSVMEEIQLFVKLVSQFEANG